jgi:hypothetical protein
LYIFSSFPIYSSLVCSMFILHISFLYITIPCLLFSILVWFFSFYIPSFSLCLLFLGRFWSLYICRHQTSLASNTIHYCPRFRAEDWFLLLRRKAIREGVIRIATCLTHGRC